MSSILCARRAARLALRPHAARRFVSSATVQPRPWLGRHKAIPPILLASVLAVSAFTVHATLHLDADVRAGDDSILDPATGIAFPTTLTIPSKTPLPTFSLVGVGVRTLSFLRIQVYSVGFYADLSSPSLHIPKDASPDEKIDHIVRNAACVLRIVPTRSTSYGHLRDGFMRAIQARLRLCRDRGALSPEEEATVQSPLRKFKSIFPNTPLAKHAPLDILLTPPSLDPGTPRTLIVRDLGAVQNDWLAREFVLAYFEGQGLSPPMRKAVVGTLQDFGN
ncbi:chalcone-flavanone isomerase-domain-containing protein [Amylocystis lapponica]|nr:chalcone-flavanone isomerase-domain-containing protein [Amylocystis lapponica]